MWKPNKVWGYLVETFSKPAFNPTKQWTAVVTSRYFKGSFDFENFDKAREYLAQQCARKGVTTSDDAKDTVQFGGTFVINRDTFEVFSLADLGLAFERSNPWHRGRNACLTPPEHERRVNRVRAYLEARKARVAGKDPRAEGFNYGAPLPEPLWDATYQAAKLLAEVLRKRNSGAARQRSWDFDMRVRAVRVSCSQAEQDKTLAQLNNVLGDYFRHVTARRHALIWLVARQNAFAATFAR